MFKDNIFSIIIDKMAVYNLRSLDNHDKVIETLEEEHQYIDVSSLSIHSLDITRFHKIFNRNSSMKSKV